jgi:hypothetical protein
MSDTDCFFLWVLKNSEDKDKTAIEILKEEMDFSNYPTDHSLYNRSRKNQLGYFKDELSGESARDFVGIRSKTYVFRTYNSRTGGIKEHKKAKGGSKGYKDAIPFESYKKCVLGMHEETVELYQIRSYNHKLVTNRLRKVCFSSFDDKRYLLDCGIHSVPYGSYQIQLNKICDICNPM